MERAKRLYDADYDLGTYSRQITTASSEANQWFDRGLLWMYSFNHEAAIRCFEVAVELDPSCAIAYWGSAYCNGINYNNQETNSEPGKFPSNADAFSCARSAIARCGGTSAVEQMLIDAVQVRCPEQACSSREDQRKQNSQFASEMAKVYEAFSDDPDVASLYAESMMNIHPWALWVDGKVREANDLFPGTARILEVLRSGLAKHPQHPGLLHMYLHTMEMSPKPGDSLPECARLRDLMKDSGHLLHMPSHIDVLVGNYQEAVVANTKAIETDRKYIERNGADNFYMLYCCHDCHMKVYAAMLGGMKKDATDGAAEVREWLSRASVVDMLRAGMADFLEAFVGMHLHVRIRFGQWKEILDEPLPKDEHLYCVSLAMLRYARVLAYAALRDVEQANSELAFFKEAYAKVPATRTLFNNTSRDILAVAQAMAEGEVAYREGKFELAFKRLRAAVALDDGMLYDEPWGWMQPARHALGALLLEQGHVDEATDVYREDLKLGHNPRNVWSLHGLAECLEKSPSLAKEGELEVAKKELAMAMKWSDVAINASCFCALSKCCA